MQDDATTPSRYREICNAAASDGVCRCCDRVTLCYVTLRHITLHATGAYLRRSFRAQRFTGYAASGAIPEVISSRIGNEIYIVSPECTPLPPPRILRPSSSPALSLPLAFSPVANEPWRSLFRDAARTVSLRHGGLLSIGEAPLRPSAPPTCRRVGPRGISPRGKFEGAVTANGCSREKP